jgi:pimeloyl-[acyl-carrier protein] methyl ester esterase
MALKLPKLILLPGMDGTGELFSDFVRELPTEIDAQVVRYPTDRCLSYSQLAQLVRSAAPASAPFVLIAESFSTPLAIQYAATKPPNLWGVVICAGFVTSPARSWLLRVGSFFLPILFRLPLPEFVTRRFLVGRDAPSSLLSAVRVAVSSVQPKVLSARIRAVLGVDAREELRQIAVPLLYLQAEQDRSVGPSCFAEIQQIRPQIALTIIDGPHLILQREPRRTAEAVIGFIQKLV